MSLVTRPAFDACRIKSRELDRIDLERINRFKRLGNEFIHELLMVEEDLVGIPRPSLEEARKKIEEAVMWATKGVSG